MRFTRMILFGFLLSCLVSCQSMMTVLAFQKTSTYSSLKDKAFSEFEMVTALEDPMWCRGMAGKGIASMGAQLQIVIAKPENGLPKLVLVYAREDITKGDKFKISKSFNCSQSVMSGIKKSDYLP